MKLIDYDKHRTEIQQKVMEATYNPNLSCRKTVDEIMKLLDSLPVDYTETQIEEVDRAYQRVCRELEDVRNESEDKLTSALAGASRIMVERIDQIQALLLQYPGRSDDLLGRLDELHMTLAEYDKWLPRYFNEFRRHELPPRYIPYYDPFGKGNISQSNP